MEIKLNMTVYHKDVYDGKEPLVVVGIRKDELELEGDFSGGTHPIIEKSWLPIEGVILGDLEDKFLETHKDSMNRDFWEEQSKNYVFKLLESSYKTYVIKKWRISDIVSNGDKLLVKWSNRVFPLTDEQIFKNYGRKIDDDE